MSRARAPILSAAALWAGVLLSGCASPGEPTARHPVVPLPVTDLAARQQGTDVMLAFTLPDKSTDRMALAESPTIEISRATLAPGATPNKKTPWRLAYTIPPERVDSYLHDKRIEFRDPLTPADLGNAQGSLLAYMVRTRAVRTRASEDSNILTVRVFPPPAVPSGVRTDVTESAIAVSWNEATTPTGASFAGYRVYRAQLESGQEKVLQDLSLAKWKPPVEMAGPTTSTEFRDTHFEFGETYRYTVRSMAAFGTEIVDSSDSAPAIVTPRDIFPPAAPGGLEAANVPATQEGASYVELSWAISTESDLAGYRVYRSQQESEVGNRLNDELLPTPAFRDISVVAGKRYYYRVSAVDRSGNESPMSPAITVDVP